MNRIGFLVLTGLVFSIGTSESLAQDASYPRFKGTPSVTYSGSNAGAVIRLDRALDSPRSSAGFVIAPTLRVGQRLGDAYGGVTPGAVGAKGRHCYAVELIQQEPRRQLRDGARWRLGLMVGPTIIRRTIRVTVKTSKESRDWQEQAMKRLGCGTKARTAGTQ